MVYAKIKRRYFLIIKFFSVLFLVFSLHIKCAQPKMLKDNQAGMKIILTSEEKIYSQLIDKITTEAAKITHLPKVNSYCLQTINSRGEMVGGLAGYEFYGSFVIDVLWIEPDYRKKGVGSSLLKYIEKVAKEKGLLFLSVSTMEWWDCLSFYEKNGFKLEFVRKGFAKGYKQYHLIKNLILEERDEN